MARHTKDRSAGATRAAPLPLSPLDGAHIAVDVDDLLAVTTLTQRWINRSPRDVEAVFTFPLPVDATWLGLAATVRDRRIVGRVAERRDAGARYEAAIDGGDAAVLLEQVGDGLYTVNLGNVRPEEDIAVEIRVGQWLRWNDRTVRFRFPLVIAPRYGRAPLPPRETPSVDLLAEYRYRASVAVRGLLAAASVTSPSHALTFSTRDGSLVVGVRDAFLDRDFVLDFARDDATRASAIATPGADETVVAVSFAADVPVSGRRPLVASIAVDCSGSMAGVSIDQTRHALAAILARLETRDRVNLIRFGSSAEKHLPRPSLLTDRVRGRLEELIAGLEADLGGTELMHALELAADDVGAIDAGKDADRVVFLVTDGEVWNPDTARFLARCAELDVRVFAVGVGAATVEATLRPLADTTGGALEMAYPGDDLGTTIMRQFSRIAVGSATFDAIDWPAKPAWCIVPKRFHAGDTVVLFAGFGAPVDGDVTLRWTSRDGAAHDAVVRVRTDAAEDAPSALARMAAQARLAQRPARRDALSLALAYQLLTEQTACVLVAERAADDKADGAPVTVQVPQMMAAGWGGMPADAPMMKRAAMRLAARAPAAHEPTFDACLSMSLDADTERYADSTRAPDTSLGLRDFIARVAAALHTLPADDEQALDDLALLVEEWRELVPRDVARAIDALACRPEIRWLALLLALAERPDGAALAANARLASIAAATSGPLRVPGFERGTARSALSAYAWRA